LSDGGLGQIDPVCATADLSRRGTSAHIDREARTGKGPSDHASVVLDVAQPTMA
jgi:exodeoxyribonuclease-3